MSFNNARNHLMISNGNIRAIIWDYDGTLVDTRLKNLNVTTWQIRPDFEAQRADDILDIVDRIK